MDFTEIRYEVADHVATITLDRPERLNAYTRTMHEELIQAFDLVDADDDVRAVIVTGAGRGFCAGADLEGGGETFDWTKRQGRGEMAEDSGTDVPRDGGGILTLRIFRCTKPVIAAINGPAVGVGITMTLPWTSAWPRREPRSASCSPAAGSCPRHARAGSCRASSASPRRWSGWPRGGCSPPRRRWPGGSCAASTRRTRCCRPPGRWPRRSSENSAPVSVALARRLMWTMLGASHPMEAHRADSRAMFARGQSEDAREGIAAFLEKRAAEFPDSVSAGLPEILPEWEEPEFR